MKKYWKSFSWFYFLKGIFISPCACALVKLASFSAAFGRKSLCSYGKEAPRELWCQRDFAVDRCTVTIEEVFIFLCKLHWQELPNISLRVGECLSH